jgi:hypothetical protein
VTYYELSWDQGTDNWVTLTSPDTGLVTTFTHNTDSTFPSGSSHKYRVRGKNGVGMGSYSSPLTVTADEVPTFMNTPIVNQVTGVAPKWIYLTWAGITSPVHTGRDTVIYYELQWLNYNTNTWTVLTNEATDPLALSFNFTSNNVFPSRST